MLTEKTISQSLASKAIAAMAQASAANGQAAVFTVLDRRGELVAFLRQDGANLASTEVSQRKAYTAARLGIPSRTIGDAGRDPVNGFELANFGEQRFTFWAGGLPIIDGGECVGAIGVSGLTNDEDEDLARVGLAAIIAV
jgi:glc operon protein GlcG